jgi:hypothetical protein
MQVRSLLVLSALTIHALGSPPVLAAAHAPDPAHRKPRKSATFKLGELSAQLKGIKSKNPGRQAVEISLTDTFLSDLITQHHWTDAQVRALDAQLLARLPAGQRQVDQEDDDLLRVEFQVPAGDDAVTLVERTLAQLIQTPTPEDGLPALEEALHEARRVAEAEEKKRMDAVRVETELTTVYWPPVPGVKNTTHDGFAIARMSTIKSTKGLHYNDRDILRESTRLATKKGYVVLQVTVGDGPFMRLYGDARIKSDQTRDPSLLKTEALLRSWSASPDDILFMQTRAAFQLKDFVTGETVYLVCREAFARKAGEKIAEYFKAPSAAPNP